jgi:hypothetical protein
MSSYDWERALAAWTEGNLEEALATRPLPVTELLAASPAAREGEPYGRQPLHRSARGEVLLVGWRENTFSAPHDHANAIGLVHLLRGRFMERHWRWNGTQLTNVGTSSFFSPSSRALSVGEIHDMKAERAGVSLHFYAPGIDGMRIYDRRGRRTWVVGPDAGAWVPAPEGCDGLAHVLAIEPWPADASGNLTH